MGPSGSGKSTLMNLIGCLDTPTVRVVLPGRQPGQRHGRRRAGAHPQQGNRIRVPDLQSAGARHGAAQRGAAADLCGPASQQTRKSAPRAALRAVDLEQRMLHKPSELSGRPAPARRDRPRAGEQSVDSAGRRAHRRARYRDRQRNHGAVRTPAQQGNTIVLVTHEHDIAMHAHRMIHIRDGKVERDEKVR